MDGRRWWVALALILVASSTSSLWVQSTPTPTPGGRGRVFSLFNLKDKSPFWTDSLFHRGGDDLQSAASINLNSHNRNRLLNYTKAGNMANYVNLLEVDSLFLPLPVNFVFIGFQEFNLTSHELHRWFSNINHVYHHAPLSHLHHQQQQQLSHIHFNFSVHAILTGQQLSSIVEHALNVSARPDHDNDGDAPLLQVDVDLMASLFSSLADYLQPDNAYTIFVLNPKNPHPNKPKYGYRRGLSHSEIQFLKQNKTLRSMILESRNSPQTVLALEKIKRPLYEKHPGVEFAFRITQDSETEGWHKMFMDALNNMDKANQGKDAAHLIHNKVVQLLKGKHDDLSAAYEKELKSGDFSDIRAECLTDTWIGKDRWAFIDLSAGPFSWGPAVGGEGVRTHTSLPNVETTIGAISEISEDEAENRLQDAIQEKFSVLGEKDHQAIDILLAEIDIYELFSFKHCKGRKVKLALCEELDERMQDLKSELQSFEGQEYDEAHKRKAVDALKRMENWNLFSDSPEEEHQNYTIARDTFLSHLGATLWGSMRHVISPSIGEGAFHYYEKISFQLFFVTQEKYRRLDQLPLDLEALKDGLSSLLLPSQKLSFDPHMLPLSEDPALAMAFSVARRAAAVPLLLVNGTYRKNIHTYLDSSILQYQLQRLTEHGSLKGTHAHSRSTLEVPIFWFLYGDPLFVDKHYQAKALSDMVIVVQSETSSWESHLQCNGKPLLWDLRRPIKAALAAASEHLAGLMPLHLVYSQAHETAVEDWMWSVGCNPYSVTSQGWHISKFQSDTIARSYIITSVEESVQMVNSAIHLLVMEHTSEKSFKVFESQERELVNKYNYVVSLWRRISLVTGEVRYGDAVRLLPTLEDASKSFYEYVNATIAILHPIHCTKVTRVDVVFDMSTIPAFVIVAAIIVYSLLRPRRPKPKIN